MSASFLLPRFQLTLDGMTYTTQGCLMRAGNICPQKAGKGKGLTLLVTVVVRTFGGYREWWPLLQPIVGWANSVCNQLETALWNEADL